MGDWRHNKDDEVELDGIGGVNILVKADVHRSGQSYFPKAAHTKAELTLNRLNFRNQLPMLRIRKSSRNRRLR